LCSSFEANSSPEPKTNPEEEKKAEEGVGEEGKGTGKVP
jgi:hypothetical protein